MRRSISTNVETPGPVRGMLSSPACALAVATSLLFHPPAARAGILAEYTGGTDRSCFCFAGQSATTPAGGFFDNIVFNYFDFTTNTAIAPGTLYVFATEYTGLPSALSGAAFLAKSIASAGGYYIFDPALTLAGSTEYYFYNDQGARLRLNGFNPYTDGTGYSWLVSPRDIPFTKNINVDYNFQLSGLTVPVPAPAPLGVLALPLSLLLRRHRAGKRRSIASGSNS